VNCADGYSITPLMHALCHGQLMAAKLLHERGADPMRVDIHSLNILHFAAFGGDLDCIEWVFANTAIGVNSTTSSGRTAVMITQDHGHIDAAKCLVEKGANLFIKDSDGRSASDRELGPQLLQHAKDILASPP
jgi:ankyrin repeat protein